MKISILLIFVCALCFVAAQTIVTLEGEKNCANLKPVGNSAETCTAVGQVRCCAGCSGTLATKTCCFQVCMPLAVTGLFNWTSCTSLPGFACQSGSLQQVLPGQMCS